MIPEIASIVANLIMMLASAFLASYLTYVLAIKRTVQERLLAERVALYRPLIHSLSSLMGETSPEKIRALQSTINPLGRELLLYAPDNIYRAFIKAIGAVRRGASVKPMVEFMVTLRKELMPQTRITSDDVFDIELKA